MMQRHVTGLLILVIGVLMVGAPFVYGQEQYHDTKYKEYVSQIDTLVKQSNKRNKKMPSGIIGGIAPHHVPTAFPLIVDFYAQLKNKEKIKTVVVLGPDHFNKNSVDIAISEKKFITPYGIIESDIKISKALQQTGFISVDEKPFEKEHSIASHAIVIKKILPHAKIIPLTFRASTTYEKAKKLGEYFAKIFDDSTLVVVSVDFSHYLPLKQARERDAQSLAFVKSADPSAVSFIDVDSPAALMTLFSYLKKKNAQQGIHLTPWNMADFESVIDNTTGYITGYFRKKDSGKRRQSLFSETVLNFPAEIPTLCLRPQLPHGGRPCLRPSDILFKEQLPPLPKRQNDNKLFLATSSIDSLNEEGRGIRLLFAGDIMLSRHIETLMKKKKDFAYHTKIIKEFMQSADLTIANFENPIRGIKDVKKGNMVFGADPKSVAVLESLGIDVVSLANNHMADQGSEGITRTIHTLQQLFIESVGAGKTYDEAHMPTIKEVKGVKIAFLAYTPFLSKYVKRKSSKPAVADMNKEEIIRDVKHAKEQADIVITMFHWGDEYKTKHNKRQEEIAYTAIDAGASLVIGHHPHVIQDIETYKNVPIIYSLGNFIFDQNFSKDTKHGLVAEIRINEDKTLTVIPHEIRFNKDFQPYIVNP